jgi:preprotein translocase subunit SecA
MQLITKFFGTKNDREIKALAPRVAAIGALEPTIAAWSDEALAARIGELKAQLTQACDDEEKRTKELTKKQINAILDPYLHETFAIVREAGKRVLNMRHFDVQLIGGMVLNSGKIAEMKTGEGKTLMATLPAVFNALAGRGVHIVTVNDYLASRDAEWMGRIYRFLGLKVGVVIPQTSDRAKKDAYLADITYGQNNEFGFDYLRDNMKFSLSEYVQRGHHFAIVDEVDSILIDEARTPLIISGAAEESSEKYKLANSVVPRLRKDMDYSIDEKSRVVILTEPGVEKAEKLLAVENLYDPVNIEILHHLNQALRAHSLFKRDVDYVIERGEVVIVDEHTGRLMHGRRWSDGLHQAIEAKENVQVQAENHTLATITFQNYFRMYKKLSGMTGTADTEAEEFAKIYDLDVLVVPTNRSMVRRDEQDQVYKTENEKVDAIVKDIETANQNGQPVLVGTVSVEKSEVLSKRLNRLGIGHSVLNAKKHRDEAGIVSQAGRAGAVTIATNMAGRGTDIILGGDPEFMARSEVSKQLSQSDEQVAEYAFLSGRPDLINIEKLAQRDREDPRFLTELEDELEAIRIKAEEAKDKGEAFTPPAELPKTIEEAQERVYHNRKAFYEKAVALYAKELEKTEVICAEQKKKVLAAGGLRIIGTERHESRRIDNQLRGRAGRQGDPGSSSFYLSLQDDLMRIFGSDRMISVMERLGMEDGVPIEHPWVSRSIANAQKRVEGFHFDSRKQLIEYDDVMNQQRNAVYTLRRKVLGGENIRDLVFDLVEQTIVNMVAIAAPEKSSPSEWKLAELQEEIQALLGVRVDIANFKGDRDDLMDFVYREVEKFYAAKEKEVGSELLRQVERFIYLQTIDRLWKEHLQAMDHLRDGIHFRGYAQKDPKQEYKREGFNIFTNMTYRLRSEVIEKIFKAEIQQGSREKVAQDISRLRENQRRDAERLKKNQVLGRGDGSAKADGSAPQAPIPWQPAGHLPMPLAGLGNPEPVDADSHLNRHQRRLLKAKEKKTKKYQGKGA